MDKLIKFLLAKFTFLPEQTWLKNQIETAKDKASLKKVILTNMIIDKNLEKEIDEFKLDGK